MARTVIPLYVTNQVITAAHGNTYWRDNEAAHWPYTAAGDMAYATAADALSRLAAVDGGILKSGAAAPSWLAAGAAGSMMYNNGASTPAWLAAAAAGKVLQMNAGGTAPEWGGALLDWGYVTDGNNTRVNATTVYANVVGAVDILTLPVAGIVFAIGWGSMDGTGGWNALASMYIDGVNGQYTGTVQTTHSSFCCAFAKSCAAGARTTALQFKSGNAGSAASLSWGSLITFAIGT